MHNEYNEALTQLAFGELKKIFAKHIEQRSVVLIALGSYVNPIVPYTHAKNASSAINQQLPRQLHKFAESHSAIPVKIFLIDIGYGNDSDIPLSIRSLSDGWDCSRFDSESKVRVCTKDNIEVITVPLWLNYQTQLSAIEEYIKKVIEADGIVIFTDAATYEQSDKESIEQMLQNLKSEQSLNKLLYYNSGSDPDREVNFSVNLTKDSLEVR